jgi:hypothetical protein
LELLFISMKIEYRNSKIILLKNLTSLTKRKLFTKLFLLLLLIPAFSSAQEKLTVTVSGTVTDAETNLPIPYANVFFNNTTLGNATDSFGKYTIYNVPIEYKELIASSIGYTTLKVNLTLQPGKVRTVDFKMPQDRKMLSTVVIYGNKEEADQDWRNNFQLFKEIFLGTSSNARQTEILNPEVLDFTTEKHSYAHSGYNRVPQEGTSFQIKATASQPIKIENRALGYKLEVTLDKFIATSNVYQMLITTRFDTLTSKNIREKRKWQQNRIMTYKGSHRHLFKSIMTGRYLQEGFNIYQGKLSNDPSSQTKFLPSEIPATAFNIFVDTINRGSKVLRKGMYQINYNNKLVSKNRQSLPGYSIPVSWIEVRDTCLTLSPNGEPVQPANYWKMGNMDSYRIADILPYDFNPVAEEVAVVTNNQIELLSIKGTVRDGNNDPLPGVDVFINNGLTHTNTNAWGQFELTQLKPGKYPIGFAYGGMKEILRIVELSGEDKEMDIQLMEEKTRVSSFQRDGNWESTKDLFERKLIQENGSLVASSITNSYVLNFKPSKKKISVIVDAPIIVENTALGYQWTYFMDSASLIKKKGVYELEINGLVKIDTLTSTTKIGFYRWQNNRFNKYQGSWNNFTKAIIEGRVEDEGFKIYQLKKLDGKRRLKFKRVIGHDLVSIIPDSLLVGKGEKFHLNIPKGLEIHYNDKKGEQKFYKGFSKQVIRLTSDSSLVSISSNGVIAPQDLHVAGIKDKFLKRVPVDFKVPTGKITDPDVEVFVKEANLKSIKNLLEKTYIQTDKPYYYPGDTIWLKAYLKYSNLNYQDSLSKVLYVDLVDPKNKIIANRILKITEGQAWGDFVLALEMPAGDYYLRSYTSWGRNFDQFFTRPIPIISRENFIVSQKVDTTSFIPDDLNISLQSNKTIFTTRDEVKLTFQTSNDEGPVSSSLSISVTDQSAVSDLDGVPDIQSLSTSFRADGSKMIRLKYPIEKGVTLHGKIRDAFKNENYSVATVFLPDRGFNVIKTKGADFRLTFDIDDTVSVVIKCTDQSNSFLNSDILPKDSLSFFILPDPLVYQIYNNTSYTREALHFGKNNRVLSEVVVKAKRITPGEKREKTLTERRLGSATQIIEGQAILDIRKSQNLASSLLRIIPDFANTFQTINQNNVATAYQVPVYGRMGRTYSISLDDQNISYSDFSSIPVASLSRIYVYKGEFNVVAIYTEDVVPLLPLYDKYLLRGYDSPLVFKTPDIKSNLPDYRSTVYWNPLIKTDENGNATISFRTSDVEGNYKVTMEGITSQGEIFRLVKLVTVTR